MRLPYVHLPDLNQTINLANASYVIHDFRASDNSIVDRVVFGFDGFTNVKSHADRARLRQALARLDMLDPQNIIPEGMEYTP